MSGAGEGHGSGGSYWNAEIPSYPAIPYGETDFNCCGGPCGESRAECYGHNCEIDDYGNVQTVRLQCYKYESFLIFSKNNSKKHSNVYL